MLMRSGLRMMLYASCAVTVGLVCWFGCVLLSPDAMAAQSHSTDQLPMFGQPTMVRPEDLKKADEAFVRDSTLRFGSRQAGSNALAAKGWAAVRTKQSDLAMQYFNQAREL